jgi:hypothetical protein
LPPLLSCCGELACLLSLGLPLLGLPFAWPPDGQPPELLQVPPELA